MTRPRLAAWALLALPLAGCAGRTPAPPAAPDSVLAAALAELHLADARADPLPISLHARDSILALHGLDSAAFAGAAAYFAAEPERYLQLYDRVVDRLSQHRQDSLAGRPPDSLFGAPAPR